MQVFVGKAWYPEDLHKNKNLTYKYEGRNIGVIAKDEESAKEKIINFMVAKNSGTELRLWEIEDLVCVRKKNTSVEINVSAMRAIGIEFINIDLSLPEAQTEEDEERR